MVRSAATREVPLSRDDSTRLRHEPALDGLRATAVLATIAFHFDYSWARGGFLGVDLFFVLSGFLITTLLIVEWRRSSTIELRRFWTRRARRLLPALFLLLVLVAVFTRFEAEPWNRVSIRGDGIASLLYVGNWRFIADKQGYFQLFSAASPLRHMWTLAIEEQFYIVWPLVVLATLRVARGSLRVLTGVCVAGVAASVAVMAFTYRSGDPLRAYYGTDSRAHTILLGALLAIVLATWRPGPTAARRTAVAGVAAFAVMLVSWTVATGSSWRYYHGGAALYAVLGCVVIAGARQPGRLRRLLSFRPLTSIGRISYGLYLFHWPVIVWLVPSRVHIDGVALNALRLLVTFTVAVVSFHFVETPVRERRAPSWPWHRSAPNARSEPDWGANPGVWTRRLALPALVVTLAVVFASAGGASPAPSYLSGSQTPTFSFAAAADVAPGVAPTSRTGVTSTKGTAYGLGAKSAMYVHRDIATRPVSYANMPPPPRFIWSLGDPLFCGLPRSDDLLAATREAHKLGQPRIRRPAFGMRVLILGDSTACSLFPGMLAVGNQAGVQVAQAAVFGCGIASGEITTTRGEQITPHSERCPAMVDAAQVPAVMLMRPDIVIWMSLWEKSDLIVNGRVLVSGTPAGDAEMLRRMDVALSRITAYGAKVVLLTVAAPAPNDAQGAGAANRSVDEAGYSRLDHIDRLFAARHPGRVTIVDLAHRLCPKGPPCPETVDGMRMRPDGRHFTPAAAAYEANWLLPQVVAVAYR